MTGSLDDVVSGHPRRRSDGKESKRDIYNRFVLRLNKLDFSKVEEAELCESIGKKRKILLEAGIPEAKEVDGAYFVSAISKVYANKSEKKIDSKPVSWRDLLSYGGKGRYLKCYKDEDPTDGLVVKMLNKDRALKDMDIYALDGTRIAQKRLGGLAANSLIIDGRSNDWPFIFYTQESGRLESEVVIVQEKLLPLLNYLKKIGRKGCSEEDVQKAIRYVDKVKEFFVSMYKCGVVDSDRFNIVGNYGIRKADDSIGIFDLGEIKESEDDVDEFVNNLSSYNFFVGHGFSEIDGVYLDKRIAAHFEKNPLTKGDFFKDGKNLFGSEFDPQKSKMVFPHTEAEMRHLFASKPLYGEKTREKPRGL